MDKDFKNEDIADQIEKELYSEDLKKAVLTVGVLDINQLHQPSKNKPRDCALKIPENVRDDVTNLSTNKWWSQHNATDCRAIIRKWNNIWNVLNPIGLKIPNVIKEKKKGKKEEGKIEKKEKKRKREEPKEKSRKKRKREEPELPTSTKTTALRNKLTANTTLLQ